MARIFDHRQQVWSKIQDIVYILFICVNICVICVSYICVNYMCYIIFYWIKVFLKLSFAVSFSVLYNIYIYKYDVDIIYAYKWN